MDACRSHAVTSGGDTYTCRPVAMQSFKGQYPNKPTKQLNNICTMLDQRRRRWADVVQMLYKCFVFAGVSAYL